MKLTQKELYVIEAIVSNEFSGYNNYLPDYNTPYETITFRDGQTCWANTIDCNGAKHGESVSGKEISGVVSSLSKKGYVSAGGRGRDAVVTVTKEGWEAYQEHMKSLETPELETYTKEEFFEACEKILGKELVDNYRKVPTNVVSLLCEDVARRMLLNEHLCSETKVVRVVQVTAYNLWRKDGCHGLK